jgi:hypothetical protein
MIHKAQTIEAIRRLNPTADTEFLAGFSEEDLSDYLARLTGDAYRAAGRASIDLVELAPSSADGGDRSPCGSSQRRDYAGAASTSR